MADPNDRRDEVRDSELNPQPLPPEERRKGVSPLIWILIILAVLAAAWWLYNRSVQSGIDTTPATTTTTPTVTSEQEVAAQAERERADANERRGAERREASEAATKREASNREVAAVSRVQPDYPPAAFRNGEEGTVIVRVDVDASGTPTNVDVAKRSGSRELDRAALEAVRKWRFNPAMKDGKPVASAAEVPVEFRLAQQ
jgi:periplasmic protein TonB